MVVLHAYHFSELLTERRRFTQGCGREKCSRTVAGRNVKEMGKKGNWFTALKKAFTTSPKEKPTNVSKLNQSFFFLKKKRA